MDQESRINDVSDTSFWVAQYRAVETDRPDALFRDPLAKDLVGPRGKKISDSMANIGRYTEWAVVSRTVIIDRFIEKLISEGVDAVVNLGAGLDTRPYRMNLPQNLEWIEADYPNIIEHKEAILKAHHPKCRLTRIKVDLADPKERENFFSQVVPAAKKVLILTEGVLPYLTSDQVTELSNDLLKQSRFKYWIAEYFHSKVYKYLQTTVRDLKMKNAPFQFYPPQWKPFFDQLGWAEKETRYVGEIAAEFKRKPPMPWFAKFIAPFLSKESKEQMGRLTGYMIFIRKTES